MNTHDFVITFRTFQGKETKQVNVDGRPAVPEMWYVEPKGYEGDLLWSEAFSNEGDAIGWIERYLMQLGVMPWENVFFRR